MGDRRETGQITTDVRVMGRRGFLRLFGLGAGTAAVATACISDSPSSASHSSSDSASGSREAGVSKSDLDKAVADAIARRSAIVEVTFDIPNLVERGGIKVSGIPEKVENEDVAKGGFKNSVGILTHIVAEPGVLHVGPDHFARPGGLESFDASEGAIVPFNPLNQRGVNWRGGGEFRLPEGGFAFWTGAFMTIKVGDVVLQLPSKGVGHNYFLYIRGRNGDNQQDTDQNTAIQLLAGSYSVGNIQYREYGPRKKTNAGFVSEGQFLQEVVTSHSGGGNAGDGGASKLTAVGLNINTGGLEVATHTMGRFGDPKAGWKSEFKNF